MEKPVTIGLVLEEEILEQVDKDCELMEMKRSQYIRKILKEYMSKK